MPQKGQAYAVNAAWKEAVVKRMKERGMSRAELARKAKCGRSAITELLSDETLHSPLVPAVHEALGWPAPRIAIPSVDADELGYLFDHLDENRRAALLERARTLYEMKRDKGN